MPVIAKDPARLADPPPQMADYALACRQFSWEKVAAELGVPPDGPYNLGGLAVERAPAERLALHWMGGRGEEAILTYGELRPASARFANALKNLGLQRGDRVLFMTRPLPEIVSAAVGALRFGAVIGILPPGRNVDSFKNVAARTAAKVLVIEPESKTMVDALRKELPGLWHVIVLQKGTGTFKMSAGDFLWDDTVESAPDSFDSVPCAPGERAFLHYTDLGMSGAVCSHQAALGIFSATRLALDVRDGDTVCFMAMPGEPAFVPFTILAPLLAGATQLMIEDPANFKGYSYLATHAPVSSWYSSFKALDVVLRNDPGLSEMLARARHISVGPPWDNGFILMTALSYGSPLHAAWWDREMGSIQLAEFRASEIRPGSLGRPLPGIEADAPEGRLALRIGPGCPFVEYWGEPAQTRLSLKDGWFLTSHKVKKDAEGWFWPA